MVWFECLVGPTGPTVLLFWSKQFKLIQSDFLFTDYLNKLFELKSFNKLNLILSTLFWCDGFPGSFKVKSSLHVYSEWMLMERV